METRVCSKCDVEKDLTKDNLELLNHLKVKKNTFIDIVKSATIRKQMN